MAYSKDSDWNELFELECLLILKKLELNGFPRGMQMELCNTLSKNSPLSKENISAKVSNYKSIAGINNKSNASKNTQIVYETYAHKSIPQLEQIIANHR
jgi:hypothetical protein